MEAMERTLRTAQDADNVVTISMDAPGKSVNTCSPRFFADLAEALDSIERDRPAAVIFASAKARSFSAGVDLFEISTMTRDQVAELVALGQRLFDRIAGVAVPTVAAINGDCLGGGFELALACRYRVAANDPSISIGLPEIKLGLIPGWGGTTRLPRTIGLRRALPILLAGKIMPPRKAQRARLVDEIVRPEALLAAAKRVVLSGARRQEPSWIDGAAARLGPARHGLLAAARRKTMALTHGNYPAPLRLLEVIDAGYARGFAAGLEAERRAVVELSDTEAARNLIRLFFLRQGAKKGTAERLHAKPREVKHAAVIGGGTMGAG
ncbi:MAG: fatty acid oxidation complex subunit alpha FadJ, partial [Acidobacteria bacterium]